MLYLICIGLESERIARILRIERVETRVEKLAFPPFLATSKSLPSSNGISMCDSRIWLTRPLLSPIRDDNNDRTMNLAMERPFHSEFAIGLLYYARGRYRPTASARMTHRTGMILLVRAVSSGSQTSTM